MSCCEMPVASGYRAPTDLAGRGAGGPVRRLIATRRCSTKRDRTAGTVPTDRPGYVVCRVSCVVCRASRVARRTHAHLFRLYSPFPFAQIQRTSDGEAGCVSPVCSVQLDPGDLDPVSSARRWRCSAVVRTAFGRSPNRIDANTCSTSQLRRRAFNRVTRPRSMCTRSYEGRGGQGRGGRGGGQGK